MALLDVIVEHVKELYQEDFGAEYRRLVRSNGKLASDINERLIFNWQDGSVWVSCRGCMNEWAQTRVRGDSIYPECGTVGHFFL